jgi:hypothetical protein
MSTTATNALPHEIDMMVQSKAIGAQALAKVLREILDLEDDKPLPLALAKSKINTVEMLLDLTAANIDALTYNEADGLEEKLSMGYRALLKIFKTYVSYELQVNDIKLSDDWNLLDREQFNDYRFTSECSYRMNTRFEKETMPNTERRGVPLGQHTMVSQNTEPTTNNPHTIISNDLKKMPMTSDTTDNHELSTVDDDSEMLLPLDPNKQAVLKKYQMFLLGVTLLCNVLLRTATLSNISLFDENTYCTRGVCIAPIDGESIKQTIKFEHDTMQKDSMVTNKSHLDATRRSHAILQKIGEQIQERVIEIIDGGLPDPERDKMYCLDSLPTEECKDLILHQHDQFSLRYDGCQFADIMHPPCILDYLLDEDDTKRISTLLFSLMSSVYLCKEAVHPLSHECCHIEMIRFICSDDGTVYAVQALSDSNCCQRCCCIGLHSKQSNT